MPTAAQVATTAAIQRLRFPWDATGALLSSALMAAFSWAGRAGVEPAAERAHEMDGNDELAGVQPRIEAALREERSFGGEDLQVAPHAFAIPLGRERVRFRGRLQRLALLRALGLDALEGSELVRDVAQGIGEHLVVALDRGVVFGAAPRELGAKAPAVEDREAQRRARRDGAARGGKESRGAEALQSHQGDEVHVRIEARLRRIDAVRRGRDPPALGDQVRPPAEELRRNARGESDRLEPARGRARDGEPAIRAFARERRELMPRERDRLLELLDALARGGNRGFGLLE